MNKKKQKNFITWLEHGRCDCNPASQVARGIAGVLAVMPQSAKVFLVLFVHKKNRISPLRIP